MVFRVLLMSSASEINKKHTNLSSSFHFSHFSLSNPPFFSPFLKSLLLDLVAYSPSSSMFFFFFFASSPSSRLLLFYNFFSVPFVCVFLLPPFFCLCFSFSFSSVFSSFFFFFATLLFYLRSKSENREARSSIKK